MTTSVPLAPTPVVDTLHMDLDEPELADDKKEDSFEFDSSGETVGYIDLAQARILTIQTASETPGLYGRRMIRMPMAFEVVGEEISEDHYIITLSFRPQGGFAGVPGREQFFIDKVGTIVHRQVMSLPTRSGWRRWFW